MGRGAWGIAIGVAVAAIVGCGGADADGDDAGGGDAGFDAGSSGGTMIRAAEGGTVTSDDGVFRLVVPPGALAEDTSIRVRRAPDGSVPLQPGVEGSAAYEVEPDGLAFAIPASAELHYASAPAWAVDPDGGLRLPREWAIDGTGTTATPSTSVVVDWTLGGPYVVRAAVDHLSTHFVVVDRVSFVAAFGDARQQLDREWSGAAYLTYAPIYEGNPRLRVTAFDGEGGHAVAVALSTRPDDLVEQTPPPNPTLTASSLESNVTVRWRCGSAGVDELAVQIEASTDLTLPDVEREATLFFTGVAVDARIGRYSASGTVRSRVECGELPNGDPCTDGTSCASGQCVDGVCCATACDGSCEACDTGVPGVCSPSAFGSVDDTCYGTHACDGDRGCKLVLGQPCGSLDECLSRSCADGVCCDAPCDGTCQRCSTASATAGICIAVAEGMSDPGTCAAPSICDASGACVARPPATNGTACSAGTECSSGNCVDGVCCASASCATCRSCAVAGSEGSCTLVGAGTSDGADCPSPRTCSASGTCSRLPNGSPCTAGTECASTFCTDGVCCNYACFRECESCRAATSRAGVDGVCGPIREDTDPDDECPLMQTCRSYSADPTAAASCSAHLGDPCTNTSPDCYNAGFCRQGVCCNLSSCGTSAPCTSCLEVNTGMPDGTCRAVLPGTDPHNYCGGAGVPGSVCDGASSCCIAPTFPCTLPSDCCSGSCNATRTCD